MEKNNLCSKLKTKQMQYDQYNKFKWDYNNNWKAEGEIAGYTWPPRSYTCSFCKREFRSAQALGGHMNVHRRDRARLRLSPSNRDSLFVGVLGGNKNLNLDLNPSLNSNPSSCSSNSCTQTNIASSIFTKFPHFSSTLPPVCPLTDNVGHGDEVMKMKGRFGVEKLFDSNGVKKGVRLGLEMGLIKDQELDLELRLGYT
ncbi:hypothetical protein CASFOL_029943 [Castilleja foliolosa]|uniref:C2H2-type domain-containing protein n=1 Tax=Castilleja foliolosa TaxID=1961234 RepID=A0ABD3CAQ3_9LAMI